MFAAPVLAQTVWKWKDKDGVVHYSDQPGPGAERVELRSQTYTPQTVAPSSSDSSKTPTAVPAYTNLEIWKPSPESTISGTGGTVSVGIRVEPALAAAHTLWLYLDGRRVDGFAPNSTEYELMEVPRGEHTLTAVIADGKGQQVLTGKPVMFYMQQASVLRPK